MIAQSLADRASENLLYTYFELGQAAARSRIWSEAGFRACVGEFDHPICNFAGQLELTRHSATRLARIALDQHSFNVYATPSDRPEGLHRLLVDQGFRRSYELVQMIAETPDLHPNGILTRAATFYDRFQIALFMVDQFFTKQGQQFRRQVAEATAKATRLELLALKREGTIAGAAMVSFNEGLAGVYNVCVESSLRGLGIGTSMVNEILAVCAVKGAPATLQCDTKLEAWYNQFGFLRCGEIDVFSLPRPSALL